MQSVGKVKEIWRYPVKGMGGERLQSCVLTENGLVGDRIWALRDAARQEIQSCKFRPQMLLCSARCTRENGKATSHAAEVTFPDGTVLGSDSPEIHAKLSALTGFESTLEALRPASDAAFYRRYKPAQGTWLDELKATFDREPGEPLPDFTHIPPPLVDHVCIPGSFFLVTPVHLVTSATLHHLQNERSGANWDVRRFRPTFVIETMPGAEGFVEQAWVGNRLGIGSATVDCAGATPRCGAITRAQPSLAADPSVLRTVIRTADQNVGVYALVASVGDIRVGDQVHLM